MKLLFELFFIAVVCTPTVKANCHDTSYMECMMNFSKFFTNGLKSVDPLHQNAIMDLICSAEGKSAFSCVLDTYHKCPDMFNTQGGGYPMANVFNSSTFDIKTMLMEGGMDETCRILKGPCKEAMTCYETGGAQPAVVKRGVSNNRYKSFLIYAKRLCGDMKPQLDCIFEKLEHCPDSVYKKTEEDFNNSVRKTMQHPVGIVTLKDTKLFVNSECDLLMKDSIQEQDTCVVGVFNSPEFIKCVQNVSTVYEAAKNCVVYVKNKHCIINHVTDTCSVEAADFYIRNARFIWPGIPHDCDHFNPASSSIVVNGSFAVLISLFACLFTII